MSSQTNPIGGNAYFHNVENAAGQFRQLDAANASFANLDVNALNPGLSPTGPVSSLVPMMLMSNASVGLFVGNANPNPVVGPPAIAGLSAAKGSLFVNVEGSSTSDRLYVNTDGATAWASVTTSS